MRSRSKALFILLMLLAIATAGGSSGILAFPAARYAPPGGVPESPLRPKLESVFGQNGLTAPVAGYRVVAEYPHDPEAFTQGLDYVDDELYEGTGHNGQSSLRRVDLESGEVLQSRPLSAIHFGEGIAVLGDRIYQITWQTGTCFVYDRESFDQIRTFQYFGEGWGLTTDGDALIMSDGSSRIVFRDPDTFTINRSIDVLDGETEISGLNELEYINGQIWANVFTTDYIARIDPDSGEVVEWLNLAGLLSPEIAEQYEVSVLNGIAYDEVADRIFVTGKYWPTLFEIEVEQGGVRQAASIVKSFDAVG